MPRKPRKCSSTGYYHITNRGVGRARVFNEPEDHAFFLYCLQLAQCVCHFKVLAYCIMTTHFHIVIKCDGPVPTSLFQSVGARFSAYYHKRHKCAGQIFQGRFYSEAIETESHLLSAIRYVWRNPIAARICSHLATYPWSSYNCLDQSDELIDDDLLYSFMSPAEWRNFALQETGERHLEPFSLRLSDRAARKIAHREQRKHEVITTRILDAPECPSVFVTCLDAGMTVTQLARVTSIATSVMHRAFERWGKRAPRACTVEAAASP